MTYRKSYILLAGIVISLVVVGSTLAAFEMGSWARALLAFPFAFFLPGFALITLIAPGYDFRLPEQIVLSVGLSIILSILCTFLLNFTPSGLTDVNWSVMFGGLTVISCIAAIVRLRLTQADHDIYVKVALSLRQMILLGLSGVIVVIAWLFALSGATQIGTSAFTQLWMLPDAAQANVITVGIRNMESGPMRFKLTIQGDRGVYFTQDLIEVNPGETWEVQYTLPGDIPPQKIEAWLYRLDQMEGEPYRKVSYWYPSLPATLDSGSPTAP